MQYARSTVFSVTASCAAISVAGVPCNTMQYEHEAAKHVETGIHLFRVFDQPLKVIGSKRQAPGVDPFPKFSYPEAISAIWERRI